MTGSTDQYCDWVDWRNGPYWPCGKPSMYQERSAWLCHAHRKRHQQHLDRQERCWCLVTLITRPPLHAVR